MSIPVSTRKNPSVFAGNEDHHYGERHPDTGLPIPPAHPIDRQNDLDRLSRLSQEAARKIGSWGEKTTLNAKLGEIIELATTIRSYP